MIFFVFLSACVSIDENEIVETEIVSFDDRCSSANNGICEELSECPLGSDTKDCDAACSEQPWPSSIIGACAHDLADQEPYIPDDSVPSNGSGGTIGSWDGTLMVRGASTDSQIERHFRVYVPERYDPASPVPLLFALGGFSVDMYWLAEFTELNRMADRENFIVVYGHPEFRDFGSFDVFSWYVYNSAFQGDWPENPDIAYLESVLNKVQILYNIDRRRVFVSGHSRGAGLSLIAAFERPDLFAGLCAQAGFVSVSGAGSNDYEERFIEMAGLNKPAVFLVHGEDDPDVNVQSSDNVANLLELAGWQYDVDWTYLRIPNATHEWQSQYNQIVWDYLVSHPNRYIQ